ncbi:MAG TPA: ABC transporter ATP-binding protein [Pseudogracilibacillus sp.]|nr:ABC transporter ATP-binding protein [Pseudogracilibacillus sp.]
MLQVKQLHKSYGKKVILDNISFSVAPGEIIGLVGENGAGKSTLLHILATILQPTTGQVTLDKTPYERKHMPVLRKEIGFVPQEIAIWEEFTVAENMKFFEKLSPVRLSEVALQQLCEAVNLYFWHESVSTLSGGMKRKLNIAISLIHQPKYLLLDEPTVGIDLKSKYEIIDVLKKLATEEDKTIIYISHDMDEITQLCNRVFHLGTDPFYQTLLKKRGKEVVVL